MEVNFNRNTVVKSFELEGRAENCRDGIRYLLLSMSPCSLYGYGFGSLHRVHLKLFENHLSDNIDNDKTFSLVKDETIYTKQFLDVFNDEAQKLYGLSFCRCEDSLYVVPKTLDEFWYLHWMRYYHKEFGTVFMTFFILGWFFIPVYLGYFISTIFKYGFTSGIRSVLKF